MILGDILSRPVECGGERIGVVVDARFVLRDADRPGRAPADLVGLLVGQHTGMAFLGYERSSVARPHLLNRWLAYRQRDCFLVDIDDVAHLGEVVELRADFDRWSPMLPE